MAWRPRRPPPRRGPPKIPPLNLIQPPLPVPTPAPPGYDPLDYPLAERSWPLVGDDGVLNDFETVPGDPPIPLSHLGSARNRWGARVLLSFANAIPGVPGQATLIDTGDIGKTVPINTQLRFAKVDAQNNAVLPFTPAWPFLPPADITNRMVVQLRRGVEPQSPLTVDTHFVTNGNSNSKPTFDVDIVTARALGLDVVLDNPPNNTGPFAVWVEAIATVVTEISDQNKVPGWNVGTGPAFGGENFVLAVASPANVTLLQPRADRAQFIIVNTSTNADMYVLFSNTLAADPTVPRASVVLPKNTFATYESPVGGWRGTVTASWNDPAPNGGALVTEGTYF